MRCFGKTFVIPNDIAACTDDHNGHFKMHDEIQCYIAHDRLPRFLGPIPGGIHHTQQYHHNDGKGQKAQANQGQLKPADQSGKYGESPEDQKRDIKPAIFGKRFEYFPLHTVPPLTLMFTVYIFCFDWRHRKNRRYT